MPEGNNLNRHYADTMQVGEAKQIKVGDYMDVGCYFAWWGTSVKNMPVTQVLQHYKDGEFYRWKQRRFAQPYNDQQYWFYFILSNNTREQSERLALAFLYKGYTATLYKISNDGYELIDSNTAHNPIAKRPFPYHTLVFPFTVPTHTTVTYLVKVQKTTVSSLIMPIWLVCIRNIYEQSLATRGTIYSFFGFFLFMIFFTLLLYFIFRDKIYLFQCLYIISTCFYIFNWFNEDSNILPDVIYVPYSYLPPLLLPLCSTLLMLCIFKEFIPLKSISLKWNKLISILKWSNITVLGSSIINAILFYTLSDNVFMTINKWLQLIALTFFTIFFSLFIASAIKLYKKVNKTLKVYLAFLVITLLLWSIQLLNQSGLSNLNIIMNNNLMLGLSIEIIVFTFITLYRFFEERAEKVNLLQSQLFLQQTLNNSVMEAQESERKRIAEELHDGLGGFLTALRFMVNRKKNHFEEKMDSEATETMLNVQEKLDAAIKDVRDISHNLMPGDFASKKFTVILKEHLNYLNEHGNIRFEYFLDERSNQIEKSIQVSLFRIASELIRNVQTHSGATITTIQIIAHQSYILLQVEDNGNGFKIGEGMGIGLKNIQSRVDFHGGKMMIDSGKLSTIFTIEIPVTYGDI